MRRSVCLCTFNGERFVLEQVASILEQLGAEDELIVVDDASTDGTVALLEALGDARVHLTRSQDNHGPVRSFERALAQARGDLVFLSDQDDVWLAGKVSSLSAALAHAHLVVSDCRVVDAALRELHPSFFAQQRSGPGVWRNLVRNSYLGCCMALRREVLDVALPFPPRVPMHDWWLGLVAQSFGHVTFVPETLSLYRRHGGNASTAAQRSTASWRTRIEWRARIAAALAMRRFGRRALKLRSLARAGQPS
jgi:glycosyltransferase involved in cell wall biosynthesis